MHNYALCQYAYDRYLESHSVEKQANIGSMLGGMHPALLASLVGGGLGLGSAALSGDKKKPWLRNMMIGAGLGGLGGWGANKLMGGDGTVRGLMGAQPQGPPQPEKLHGVTQEAMKRPERDTGVTITNGQGTRALQNPGALRPGEGQAPENLSKNLVEKYQPGAGAQLEERNASRAAIDAKVRPQLEASKDLQLLDQFKGTKYENDPRFKAVIAAAKARAGVVEAPGFFDGIGDEVQNHPAASAVRNVGEAAGARMQGLGNYFTGPDMGQIIKDRTADAKFEQAIQALTERYAR